MSHYLAAAGIGLDNKGSSANNGDAPNNHHNNNINITVTDQQGNRLTPRHDGGGADEVLTNGGVYDGGHHLGVEDEFDEATSVKSGCFRYGGGIVNQYEQ